MLYSYPWQGPLFQLRNNFPEDNTKISQNGTLCDTEGLVGNAEVVGVSGSVVPTKIYPAFYGPLQKLMILWENECSSDPWIMKKLWYNAGLAFVLSILSANY